MRIVHLSDLHLGFRQYQRQSPAGINQREVDVATTFSRAIDRIIALEPEVVLLGGDVFHHVRPGNPAIVKAFIELSKLVNSLPNVHVVIAAGNHDLPRTTETGCILSLFARLDRIDVAISEPRQFVYRDLDLTVLAVPYTVPRPRLTTDPASRYNVMVIHGPVEGVVPRHPGMPENTGIEIMPDELTASDWDYIGLGHYHVYHKVGTNAWYSGSIDYTSSNVWGELHEQRDAGIKGKGFIEHDLATGDHRFHDLEPSRPLVDLRAISARGLSSADLDDAMRKSVDACAGGIDDKIVRLVVKDAPRHIVRELDHKALREYRRRAFHFHLDPRRPEVTRDSAGPPGRRLSLAEVVRDKLQARVLPSDVNREKLVDLGLRYLAEADLLDAVPAAAGATDE